MSSNNSPTNATDLGTGLPISLSDTVDINEAWYKYTAQVGDEFLSIHVWNSTESFADVVIYDGITAANAGTPQLNGGISPIQWVPTVGNTYYFQIFQFAGTSSIAFLLQGRQPLVAPEGTIVVPNDVTGQQVVFVDGTNGDILGAINPYATGESSQVLTNGISCSEQFDGLLIKIYSPEFVELVSTAWADWASGRLLIANNRLSPFFIGSTGSRKVTTISVGGTFGSTTWTVATGLAAMAVSMDGTLLYYCETIAANTPVKLWNLLTDSANGTFVPGIVGYFTNQDILVLTDGTVIVPYHKADGTSLRVKSYDSFGVEINSADYALSVSAPSGPRITYGADDLTSFWVWRHAVDLHSDALSTFTEVLVSDFSTIQEFNSVEFQNNRYEGSASATPSGYFGHPESCAFFISRVPIGGTANLTVVKVTDPTGSSQSFDFTTTGGLDPNTFSLQDGESQIYTELEPGTYGVTETAVDGWTTEYEVSNGDPNDAIELEAGDNVTVTVTNTFNTGLRSGIYKIVPGKRNDTLWVNVNTNETEDVPIP